MGESGCGKSMTALAMMRLMPDVARFTGGRVRVAETDMTALSQSALDQQRDAAHWPEGCRFNPRCPLAVDRCRSERPALEPVEQAGHQAACWRSEDVV